MPVEKQGYFYLFIHSREVSQMKGNQPRVNPVNLVKFHTVD